MAPHVVKELRNYPDVFEISGQTGGCLSLSSSMGSRDEQDQSVAAVLQDLRRKNVFVTLRGWRDEVKTLETVNNVNYGISEAINVNYNHWKILSCTDWFIYQAIFVPHLSEKKRGDIVPFFRGFVPP